MVDQYSRSNNIAISGIADSVGQDHLEEKVVFPFSNFDVAVIFNDTEACHRTGENQNN